MSDSVLKLRKKEREQSGGSAVLLVQAITVITVAVAGGLKTEASGARVVAEAGRTFTL